MEKPHSNEPDPTKGVLAHLMVRGQAGVAVVVAALDDEDAGVDGHDHTEDEDADTDPAALGQSEGETQSSRSSDDADNVEEG